MKHLILSLLFAVNAYAEEINVQVIHVRGFGGVSVSQGRTVAESVRNFYEGNGIKLNITGFRSINNTSPSKFKSSSYQFGILEDFRRWRRSHPYNRRMVLFITPPAGGYLLGAAQTACSIYGTAYAAAEIKNMEGKDRVVHSFTALAHEVGHLLGAEHDESPTLMNANALPLVRNEILPLSKVSLKQINGCLGR